MDNATYDPNGRMIQIRLGNNLWETRDYQTPGTTTYYKLGTTQGNGDLVQLGYNFSGTGNNGNVVSQEISRFTNGLNLTQSFTYDGVNRLLTATEGSSDRNYEYDRYGNRWIGTSNWPAANEPKEPTSQNDFIASTNRLTLTGVEYDAAGNQTTYGAFTLGYDAENRNTSTTSTSSGSGSFVYDGEGRRVKKMWTPYGDTTVTTYFVYNALGQLAAEYSSEAPASTGASWIFTDMLGSVRAITSESQSVEECYDYEPFGRMLSASDNGRGSLGCFQANPDNSVIAQKFTSKERDAETGLDFFGARYFSAAQGRFTSPDIAGPRLNDPQSLNRYNYTRNNPLKRVDPDGLYDRDVHLSLTWALAEAAGFNDAQGYGIALADQGVDVNAATSAGPGTDPRQRQANLDWHFPTPERLKFLHKEALASPSEESLGQFLHVFQDSFAHAGYTNMITGHGKDFQRPDDTWRRPDLANTMAMLTYSELVADRGAFGARGAAVPWDIISGYVNSFNRAEKQADKDKALSSLREAIVNYRRRQGLQQIGESQSSYEMRDACNKGVDAACGK
jgi:RHS repeat-associated protein